MKCLQPQRGTMQPGDRRTALPGVRSADLRLSSPTARLLHYLKLSLVFICRAGDVATSSTFPSPAVYIREPIWRYKTRRQEGGGPEPERWETWRPFYRAADKCAVWRNVKDVLGVTSHRCSDWTKKCGKLDNNCCEMGTSGGFGTTTRLLE